MALALKILRSVTGEEDEHTGKLLNTWNLYGQSLANYFCPIMGLTTRSA
jgi:hypothetical protein